MKGGRGGEGGRKGFGEEGSQTKIALPSNSRGIDNRAALAAGKKLKHILLITEA